ncbi:hypothetical protein ACLBOM_08620 [Escherichia coli]
MGFSVGSQSLKVTDTATDTTQKGSTVGSVHGDVSLQAETGSTVNGSDLIAAGTWHSVVRRSALPPPLTGMCRHIRWSRKPPV